MAAIRFPRLSLKGSDMTAQGNALGKRDNTRRSPERAQHGTPRIQDVPLGYSVRAFQTTELRHGFTLVELLVVMALIAALATLAIAFLPNAASAQRESRAAQLLQGWLNIAKQRALRDQAPRGLRLWINPAYYAGNTLLANVVTDCQYIEQPDDFPSTSGIILSPLPSVFPGYSVAAFSSGGQPLDLSNGFGVVLPAPQPRANSDPNAKYWLVQPDDYLEVLGNGQMHRIVQIGVRTAHTSTVVVTPVLPAGLSAATTNWRIVRAPRVVGDETLKMPDFTLIDLNTNAKYAAFNVANAALPLINPFGDALNEGTGYVDILFAPNGSVISRGVSTANLNLWVRSPSEDQGVAPAPWGTMPHDPFRGDPTIVSVFVNTGFVGAFPPDPNGANPYAFVK